MTGDRDMNEGFGEAFTMCGGSVRHHLTNTANERAVAGCLKSVVLARNHEISRRLTPASLSRIPSASE